MTIQKGVRCPTCKQDLYSNSSHDWELCECGDTFVDGGFDYLRVGYSSGKPPEHIEREVDRATLPYYYDDERRGLPSPS